MLKIVSAGIYRKNFSQDQIQMYKYGFLVSLIQKFRSKLSDNFLSVILDEVWSINIHGGQSYDCELQRQRCQNLQHHE
jgi:hypothetical protein